MSMPEFIWRGVVSVDLAGSHVDLVGCMGTSTLRLRQQGLIDKELTKCSIFLIEPS